MGNLIIGVIGAVVGLWTRDSVPLWASNVNWFFTGANLTIWLCQ